MKKYPVKYIKPKSLSSEAKSALSNFPNAGPYPNIIGMRRVWGETNLRPLFLVMYESYLYNVSSEFYYNI